MHTKDHNILNESILELGMFNETVIYSIIINNNK